MQRKARKAAERWLRMELKSRVRFACASRACVCQSQPSVAFAWSQRVLDELDWSAQVFGQQTLDDNAMDCLTCLSAREDSGALDENTIKCLTCSSARGEFLLNFL